jgi:hypothetical protein
MKKSVLLFILLATVTTVIAQTPKRSRSERRSRNYKGCVTYTDSLVRRAAWITVDSMRAKNYIKN